MKLNIDCVRDVLIEFELFPIGNFSVEDFKHSISLYGEDDVLYSLVKLTEAKYINASYLRTMNGRPHFDFIYDITFQGHEFLAGIKPKSNWEKLSTAFKQAGNTSFAVITNVATNLGTAALTSKLGL